MLEIAQHDLKWQSCLHYDGLKQVLRVLTQRLDAPAFQEHVGKAIYIDIDAFSQLCGELPEALLQITDTWSFPIQSGKNFPKNSQRVVSLKQKTRNSAGSFFG